MAWFEVDIFKKCVEVDLHEYSHETAIIVSREKIKEAYEHGFKYIMGQRTTGAMAAPCSFPCVQIPRLWTGNGKKYLYVNIDDGI